MKYSRIFLLIMVFAVLHSCYKPEDYLYTSDEIFSHITVTLSGNSIPADGKSTVTLSYRLPINSDTAQLRLQLTATNGVFAESGTNKYTSGFVKIDISNKEYWYFDATLIASTTVGESTITAKFKDYERKDRVEFVQAPPTKITLTGTPFHVMNDNAHEITLTALVESSTGLASKGTEVTFDLTSPSSPAVGDFNNRTATTDSFGKATTQFVFFNTSFTGTLTFEATSGTAMPATDEVEVYQAP